MEQLRLPDENSPIQEINYRHSDGIHVYMFFDSERDMVFTEVIDVKDNKHFRIDTPEGVHPNEVFKSPMSGWGNEVYLDEQN